MATGLKPLEVTGKRAAGSGSWTRVPATLRVNAWRVLLLAVIFSAWEAAVNQGSISAQFVGKPSIIARQWVDVALYGTLFYDTWVTLTETFAGFGSGILIGAACGFIMWWWPGLARVLDPFLVMLNSTPRIALAPVIIIVLGIGFNSKWALSFANVVIVAWLTVYEGTKSVDRDLVTLMRALNASRWQIFTKIVYPTVLPTLISTFKICIGFALIGAVVGEFISAKAGLGHFIWKSGSIYELNLVWAGIFTLMIVSFLVYLVIDRLERALLSWRRS